MSRDPVAFYAREWYAREWCALQDVSWLEVTGSHCCLMCCAGKEHDTVCSERTVQSAGHIQADCSQTLLAVSSHSADSLAWPGSSRSSLQSGRSQLKPTSSARHCDSHTHESSTQDSLARAPVQCTSSNQTSKPSDAGPSPKSASAVAATHFLESRQASRQQPESGTC